MRMKKLLTFLVLLCVSVSSWADVNIYLDNGIYKIYDLSTGDLAAIKDGSYTGHIWYSGNSYTASSFKTSELISSMTQVQIGGSNQTSVLNEDDVEALDMFSNMTTLDLSAITFSDNEIAGSITCGSSIETVVLPAGLTKVQVNAAGASLTSCNPSFGSCLSTGTDVVTTTSNVTKYYYTPTGSSEEIEFPNQVNVSGDYYSGTVTEDVEVQLSIPESSTYYVNTYNNNQKVEVTPENGETSWTPNPLDVALTATSTEYSYNGTVVNSWDTYVNTNDGKRYLYDWYFTNQGLTAPNEEDRLVSVTATYTIAQTGATYGTFVNGVNQDQSSSNTLLYDSNGNAYGQIANSGDISFPLTTTYTYTYTLDGQTKTYESRSANETTLSTTHNVTYSNTDQNHLLTSSEVEVENTSTYTAVTAYVNTAGSLYKATQLAGVRSTAQKVILSGNITLAELANGNVQDNLGSDTQFDGTKYTDTTNSFSEGPYWTDHAWQGDYGKLVSFDLEDATLVKASENDTNDPNLYLRQLAKYGTTLTEVILPASLKEIPEGCFDRCTKLTNVGFPDGLEKIGAFAFRQSGIPSLYVRNTTQDIGYGAFDKCSSLEEIVFERGLTSLAFEANVFNQCTGLKHVVLPEGVTYIGEYLFNQCSNLESVRLPSTLLEIGEGCFNQCALTQITIPEGVDKIGANAFFGNPLRDIYVTNATQAPLIYSAPKDYDSHANDGNPTFGTKQLINNTADPYSGNPPVTTSDDWDTAVKKYYAQNQACVLHYPEGAESIYDDVTITASYGVTGAEGIKLPLRNNNDYVKRLAAADTGNDELGTWTRDGWKQFALQKSFVPNQTDILTKQYKDVWYTMCFPFNLSDEQLEEAFNSHYNICEFNNVEIKQGSDGLYYLVLHFNQVATDYSEYDDATSLTAKKKYDGDTDASTHFLAKAFHPYMIHPNIGTKATGAPVNCYFSGIRFLDLKDRCNTAEKEFYWGESSTIAKGADYFKKTIEVNQTIEGETVSGTFSFVGNVNRSYKDGENTVQMDDGVVEYHNPDGAALIPKGAYFLATPNILNAKPKYYLETSSNTNRTSGYWTLYSAIVLSDQTVEAKLKEINTNISGSEPAPVKALDIDFSEFIPEDATAIEQIVEEAKKNDIPVQYMNIVYDFGGNIVKKGDACLENLPTGMYIVNGKKYLVK